MKKQSTPTLTRIFKRRAFPTLLVLIATLMLLAAFFFQQNTVSNNEMAKSKSTANAVAYFAGGCFWSTESAFEKLDGVTEAVSGYMGGMEVNPSYEAVASGKTKHRETVKVSYDSSKITYEELTEYFLKNI